MELYEWNRKIACINHLPFTYGQVDQEKLTQAILMIKEILRDLAIKCVNIESAVENGVEVVDQISNSENDPPQA